MRPILVAFLLFLLTSCSTKYYVVRHAEKQTTPGNNDPELTDAGKQRAERLKFKLRNKKIAFIFATKTTRAMQTAAPTAAYFHLTPANYPPMTDSSFIAKLKGLNKNTLIVGHSNTVDD